MCGFLLLLLIHFVCISELVEVLASLMSFQLLFCTVYIIGFHEAGDGYLVTFPQGENVQALIDDYKGRLRDLENNIWQH